MGSFFYRTYQQLSQNKFFAIILLLIVVGILSFLASRIEFEEDITKLIPTNSKTKDIEKVLKTVNFTDKIIVNIQRSPEGSAEDLTAYASQFIDRVENKVAPLIQDIQGKVDDDTVLEAINFVYSNVPLFLDEEDYEALKGKIHRDSIAEITSSNYKTLISPSGIVAKKTILKDPLGLSFMGLKKLQQLGIGDDFTLKDGFLLSKDEQNVLLFMSPTYGSGETAENAKLSDSLYAIQERLNTTFNTKVKSEYFGAALIAVANAKQIKKDIQFTVGIALTILMLIFILFYRKLSIPLILFAPTVFGGLLSVAFLFLIRTQISAISLGIGSVLLGVTLDYSLHILTHIRNNETIKSLYHDVTKPVLMSSITTAFAFSCLLFLESQALQDLGVFAAVSVMGASVFALMFIPLVYKNKTRSKKDNTLIDTVSSYDFHKNKWVITGLVLVLLMSVFTYNKVTFNKDISKLNYEPEKIIAAKENLDALTNISSKSVYLATYGTEMEEVLVANDAIHEKLVEFENNDEIHSFSSIGTLINSAKIQQQKIDRWNTFWNTEVKQSIEKDLIESGETLGFKAETFSAFYALLNKEFTPLSIEDYNAFSSVSVADYIATDENFTTVTSLVKVADANAQKIRSEFSQEDQILVIDRQQMNETFLGNLKSDFNRLILYSLIAVLLVLLVFFRSFSLAIVTGIPIFLTWFLTIGIMGVFSLEFNIFNIIISTFIFGLGVDYSIFITNGLLKEYRTGGKALRTHRTSIVLSVITTILGVGVLIFAKHPALYSISLISITGIFSAAIVAFTIQPLLFRLFVGSKTERPISLKLLVHSIISFGYFGLGGFILSVFSWICLLILGQKERNMNWFHKIISKFMKSVLYTNPFVLKKVINEHGEDFKKPGMIIANHTSFLDILAIGMLHPKIIFLVNDWVYNSPVFGKAVQLAGFYPVSKGVDHGIDYLKSKVEKGYSLMAFPEGTRSKSNKVRRFHKGAFYLAELLDLDIIPVLIHGNSEVLPKGSFVIKDGSITVKISDRISKGDRHFGDNYTQRTKKISANFRKEFQELRKEIEGANYFHKVLLEDYRYKGDGLYKTVSEDIKTNKEGYKILLDEVGIKDTLVHISEDQGQLDFLLNLDGIDRKIYRYIEDETSRKIVGNSYITHNRSKITLLSTKEEALSVKADVLILDEWDSSYADYDFSEIKMIVLRKAERNANTENISNLGFYISNQENQMIILKKGTRN